MFQFGFFEVGMKILHVFNRDVGIGLCLLAGGAVTWIVFCIYKVMND